ncbi:hypothetical protein GCM10025760_24580 [Microbacterium yannicii]|uniref:DUF4190 domain-containing protein n=1 Tax=Microbacterium yannicii TaxID=671622 RepID=A0ABP9MAN1_9MICO|nr:DUF4190 domain-containing protein [Microbacterium yannicii]MCO5952838.1 hypothetical protein [Microbacterium yannicii]
MTDERMPRPAAAAPPEPVESGVGESERPVDDPTVTPVVPEPAPAPAEAQAAPEAAPEALAPAAPAAAEPAPETAEPAEATEPATPPAPRPERAEPFVSSVSPDVDLAQDASPLPGAHRGGFQRLPTAPVAVTVETAPAEPGGEFTPDDSSWQATDSAFHSGLAGWALAFAVVGLIVSMFVGWGFPIGLVAVVSAIIALRRPLENRAVAVWAIALGTLSILYSAGWLLYTALRANLLG